MLVYITAFIIIAALLGYIIYLHIQLTNRNVFIETTVRKLSGLEKSRSMDEMMTLLKEIQKTSHYSSFYKDKILEENTINFIVENSKDHKLYIHYTKEESDAVNIIKEGFKFSDSFYKTAMTVTDDKLDLTVKHNTRKYFGDYIIIICISNDIANFYSMELKKADIKDYSFENVLTEVPPSGNDNSDPVYLLAFQFIKGYINNRTGEIVKNPGFDPYYNSPAFMDNVKRIKNL